MIAAILLAFAAAPKPGPAMPPMTSELFQAAVRDVEEKMVVGDFATARKLAALLPKPTINLGWDDRKAPPDLRAAFHEAFVRGARGWRVKDIGIGPRPDIQFAFAPDLADDPESGVPANVVPLFSDSPGEPRLTAVIGLRRGRPSRPTTPRDVYNDVRYAVGLYLGLARTSLRGAVMFGGAGTDDVRALGPAELHSAEKALRLSEQLRSAIEAHTPLAPVGPSEAVVSPAAFKGEAIQGQQMDLPVTIDNHGSGTLTLDAIGDCGCVVPESGPPIPPHGSGILRLRLETREYSAPIERNVIVYTNDPKRPVFVIPVHVDIAPRYRFLVPGGNSWVVDDGGKTGDVYLTFPNEAVMNIVNARMVGLEGATVTLEKWSGSLPDPERQEGPHPRQGYRLKVTVPDRLPPGRAPVTLTILTDDSEFPILYQTINLQRGIVALPEELFLGNVGNQAKTATIILSRPGRPFKVLSAKPDLANFFVTVEPGDREGEVKLEVRYDGKALPGQIAGKILVTTDDPKQATLFVPIVGSVG